MKMSRKLFLVFLLLILPVFCCGFLFGSRSLPGKSQGDRYLERGMYDEAVVAYKQFLLRNPDDLEARLSYGRALAGDTLYARAEKEFKYVLERDPHNFAAVKELGKLLEKQDRNKEAAALYARELKSTPGRVQLKLLLAEAYFKNQRWQRARAEFENVLISVPGSLHAHLRVAECFSRLGEYRKSEEWFRRTLKISGNDSRVHAGLGELYLRMGDYEKAIRELSKVKQIKPDDLDARFMLGEALHRSEKDREAEKELQFVISHDPSSYNASLALAQMYLDSGQYQKVGKALAQVPDTGKYYYRKNMLLIFSYGGSGDFVSFWRLIRKMEGLVLALVVVCCLLIIFFVLAVGLIFVLAYYLGRHQKYKGPLFGEVKWKVREAFYVCVSIFLLPLAVGVFIGGLGYGNWFLIFISAKALSNQSVQVGIISQIISLSFICAGVFYLVKKRNKEGLRMLGFRNPGWRKLFFYPLAAISIIMLFNMAYFIVFSHMLGHGPHTQLVGKLISHAAQGRQAVFLLLFVVFWGPVVEEIIFRGFVYSAMRRAAGIKIAAFFSAVLFAMFHFQWGIFLPIAFMGIVFALLFEKTKSIYPGMISHMLWNLFSFMAMYFYKGH